MIIIGPTGKKKFAIIFALIGIIGLFLLATNKEADVVETGFYLILIGLAVFGAIKTVLSQKITDREE